MRHVWNVVFPQEAYTQDFLMHGILALAAMHKAYLVPSRRHTYLTLSAYHQNLGLEEFRPQVANLTSENWKPLFCFANFVIGYVFTLPIRSEEHRLPEPLLNMLDLFSVVRGVGVIFRPSKDLVKTNLGPLVYGLVSDSDCSSERYTPLRA
jgi:hypothetical protein